MFKDRKDAGKLLAQELGQYGGRDDVVVLALPRGGVPIAYEIARALAAPLDVIVVRKLGVPWYPEVAMGAIASGGVRVFNESVLATLADADAAVEQVLARESEELARRESDYRGEHPFPQLADLTVILVDDGVATGATMRAAVTALETLTPADVVVAVPVASEGAVRELQRQVKVVCLHTPASLGAISEWYQFFDQTSDAEVRQLLEQARESVSKP